MKAGCLKTRPTPHAERTSRARHEDRQCSRNRKDRRRRPSGPTVSTKSDRRRRAPRWQAVCVTKSEEALDTENGVRARLATPMQQTHAAFAAALLCRLPPGSPFRPGGFCCPCTAKFRIQGSSQANTEHTRSGELGGGGGGGSTGRF